MRSITTRVMGILNVTPDSFSDGGSYQLFDTAVNQAEALIAAGADIIDVGGESTRPYAEPVSLSDELDRTLPVIKAIRSRYQIPISIDTIKAEVARQAIAAGANIINDISSLTFDPGMIEVVRQTGAPVIIMHMQGSPADMQDHPHYQDVVVEVLDYLRKRVDWLLEMGIAREKIIIDPGIGFGKTIDHNLSLLKHLDRFRTLGQQVLLGHSRKGFLGQLTGLAASERDLPTAVVSALAVWHQVDIIRVHDVAATRQALQVAEAVWQAQ
ncbi:MAG: dihydropteroate synthase [Desulfopila sp.]